MARVSRALRERHLVRAPRALDRQPVDLLRAGPALRRAQHDHRPARPLARRRPRARAPGSSRDVVERLVERRRERAGARRGGSSTRVDEQRPLAVALEERDELALGDAREHRRVRDLVAVQVQDRKHGAVACGFRNLFECQLVASGPVSASPSPTTQATSRSGLSNAAPNACDERIAELAALVDRARRLGRDVARDPAGERELAEERAQPVLVRAMCG